jgi:hypothetical protein
MDLNTSFNTPKFIDTQKENNEVPMPGTAQTKFNTLGIHSIEAVLTGPAELTVESEINLDLNSINKDQPPLQARTIELSEASKGFAKETFGAPTLLERFSETLHKLPRNLGNLFKANLYSIPRENSLEFTQKANQALESVNENLKILNEAKEHSVEKVIDILINNVGLIQVSAAILARSTNDAKPLSKALSASDIKDIQSQINQATNSIKQLYCLSAAQPMIQDERITPGELSEKLEKLSETLKAEINTKPNILSTKKDDAAYLEGLNPILKEFNDILKELEKLKETEQADAHVVGTIKKNFSERLLGGIATAFQHILQAADWVLTGLSKLNIPFLSHACLVLSVFVKSASLIASGSITKWSWGEMKEAWQLSTEISGRVEKGSETRIEDPVLRAIMKGVLQKLDPKVATVDFLFDLAGIALTVTGCAVLLGNFLVLGGVLGGTALAVINPIGAVIGGTLLFGLVAWGAFKGIRSLYKMISNWNNEYALMDATRCLEQLEKQKKDGLLPDYQPTSTQYKKLLKNCLKDPNHKIWSKSFANINIHDRILKEIKASNGLSGEQIYENLSPDEKIALNEAIQNWTLRKCAKSSHDVATNLMIHLMKEGSLEEKESIRKLLVDEMKVLDKETLNAIAQVSKKNESRAKDLLQAALGVKKSIMYGHGREALGLSPGSTPATTGAAPAM